jgi:hypothetical protein
MKGHLTASTKSQRRTVVLGLVFLVVLVLPQLALADHSVAHPDQYDFDASRLESGANAEVSLASTCAAASLDQAVEACDFYHDVVLEAYRSGKWSYKAPGR